MQVPLINLHFVLTFEERLGLIAKHVLQYKHMYPLAPEMEATATSLWERFVGALEEEAAREGDGNAGH